MRMKKLLFLLCAIVVSVAAMAQGRASEAPSTYIPRYGSVGIYQLDDSPEILKYGSKLYHNGMQLSWNEFEMLTAQNNWQAHLKYTTGKKLIKNGWGCFISGLLIHYAVGGAFWWAYEASNEVAYEVCAMTAGTVGGAVFISSIPIIAVGYGKRNNSVKMYNEGLYPAPEISYNITAGENGLGFAINF